MLHFTTYTVSTDNPSMLVKNLKTGAVGNQTRPANSEESDYVEITRESYEQEQREQAIREVYIREVERRVAERYRTQEESAIIRKALALLLPAPLSEVAESQKSEESAEHIIEEFVEYNEFVESIKAQAFRFIKNLL